VMSSDANADNRYVAAGQGGKACKGEGGGAGKKKNVNERGDVACKRKACAIQTCLAAHNYDQAKCQDVIDAYMACARSQELYKDGNA